MPSLKVLIIEDNAVDAALLRRELRHGDFSPDATVVDSEKDFCSELDRQRFDVIISDFNVPGFGAIQALRIIRERRLHTPFIVVSGAIGEEAAVDLMRNGAEDFISKNNLVRLAPSIRRSLRESESRAREEKAEKVAADALRAKESMVTVVSHDLKSPLNGLRLTLQALEKNLAAGGALSAERLASYIKRIRYSADRMHALIGDVLEYSKVEAGTFAIKKSPTSIAMLTEDLMTELLPQAKEKGIDLSSQVLCPSEGYYFDKPRIVQVLANLIGNALKFTPSGGRVTLRVLGEGQSLIFEVGDNGPGIKPKDQPHIFEKFYQNPSESYRGTGLGLYITKKIVEAHDGKIELESEVGRGTRFRVTLPSAALGTLSSAPASVPEGPVLVVDDDICTKDTVTEILSEAGYRVQGFGDALEALSWLKASSEIPSLILLDGRLPTMRGEELALEISQLSPALAAVPRLLMSGDAFSALGEEIFLAHLQKPVDFDLLLATVAETLHGRPLPRPELQHPV